MSLKKAVSHLLTRKLMKSKYDYFLRGLKWSGARNHEMKVNEGIIKLPEALDPVRVSYKGCWLFVNNAHIHPHQPT